MVIPATTTESAAAVPTTTHVVQFNPAAQLPIKLKVTSISQPGKRGDATQWTQAPWASHW